MKRYWYSYERTVAEAEALAAERFRQETGRLGRVVSTLENAKMADAGAHGVRGRAVFVVEHRP